MARSLAAPVPRPALAGVTRPLTGAVGMVRAGVTFAWERRRLRFALLAVMIVVPLLAGGWMWLRHSSLTAVEHVQVRGLTATHGADVGAIEAALTGAAHGMSTLDVKPAALRAAVASFPIVRSVQARASFPHGLRIEVIEQPPVAALVAGGARTAVAADGVVLGPGFLSSSLPLVNAGASAATMLPLIGRSVGGAPLLAALTALGAAPAPLARAVTRAYSGPKGLTVVLRSGLLAFFGDATRPHAKWLSLVRVLADPSSAGAAYIDVRLPERPAAGFAPGTARPETSSTETESSSGSDPATASELAAGLDAAVGGGSSSVAASGAGGASSGTSGEPSAGGEAASSGSTSAETSSAGSTSGEAKSSSPSETGSTSAETRAPGPTPGG